MGFARRSGGCRNESAARAKIKAVMNEKQQKKWILP